MTHNPDIDAGLARSDLPATPSQAWLISLVHRMRLASAIAVVIVTVATGVIGEWSTAPWIGLLAVAWLTDAVLRLKNDEQQHTEAALMVDALISTIIVIVGRFPIPAIVAVFSIMTAAAVLSMPAKQAARLVLALFVLALSSGLYVSAQPSPWTDRQVSGLTIAAVSVIPVLTAALLFISSRRAGVDRVLGDLLGTTQTALRTTEERFSRAFDSAPAGLVITDLDGIISDANDAFADMIGHSVEDLVGTAFFDYFDPSDDQLSEEAIERMAVGESSSRLLDRRMVGADGALVEVVMSVALVDADEREAAHCITHVLDVTERRQAHAALQSSHHELSALHRISTAGLTSADMNGAAQRVAAIVGTVMGYPNVEICTHDPDAHRMRTVASTASFGGGGGRSHSEDTHCGRAALGGEPVVESDEAGGVAPRDPSLKTVVAIPIQIAEGLYGALTLSDTEAHELSPDELRRAARLAAHTASFLGRMQAEEALAALIKSKDQFITSVSHEVRTPLTAVVGLAAELRDRHDVMDPDEAADLMDIVAEQSTDVATIVEDLLVAARTDLDKLRLKMESFDAHDQVVRVIRELDHFVGGRPVIVQPLGAATVHGDRGRFRQVVRNLLTNAFRYGGTDVRVDVHEDGNDSVVQVSDDGPGIPEAEWERIFEPYERSLNGNTPPESVGIGLTVSRKLARLMGGDLTYRHQDGRSIFELRLDRATFAPKTQIEVVRPERQSA